MAEYNPSKIIKDGNTYNFRDTTKIPLSGSNQISGSLIPATTDAYDLGGSSYQWNNAYIKSLTINGVACGDILTHNASEFVNVTSGQTIGGVKKFSDIPIVVNGKTYVSQINASRTSGTQAGFSAYNGFKIVCNNDSQDWRNTAFAMHIPGYSPTNASIYFKLFDCIEGSSSYKGFFFSKDNNDFQFSPSASNSTDLGTSTNKWKSLNGINPGALSLPGDAYIDIDTTNYAWGSNFTFTPDYDGYCFLNISSSSYSRKISLKTGRGEYYFSNQIDVFRFTFPVYKGKLVTILTNSSGTESIIPTIRVFPCQGNV